MKGDTSSFPATASRPWWLELALLVLAVLVVLVAARWISRDEEPAPAVVTPVPEAPSAPAVPEAKARPPLPAGEEWRVTESARRNPTAPVTGGEAAGVASDAAAALAATVAGYPPAEPDPSPD